MQCVALVSEGSSLAPLLVDESGTLVTLALATPSADLGATVRHAWLGVAAGLACSSEVLHGFASGLAATEQERVLPRWGDQGQLVEGEAFTTRTGDTVTGRLREPQRAHAEGGQLRRTDVIQDITDDNGNRGLLFAGVQPHGLPLHHHGDTAQGNRRAVVAALQEAFIDNLVELAGRALTEELVQLDEELAVRVGRQRVVTDRPLLLLDSRQIGPHGGVVLEGGATLPKVE